VIPPFGKLVNYAAWSTVWLHKYAAFVRMEQQSVKSVLTEEAIACLIHNFVIFTEYKIRLNKTVEKLQWLQDPSEINGDNLNNVRREASRYFRNKKWDI
jgi:hypothetical protein